jgi:predicted nucleotidyltransferase
MRLPEALKTELISSIYSVFGPVPILLYGSRVHDEKRGGDIDIAIQVDVPPAEFEQKRISLLTILTRKDFPLPVDIVQYYPAMAELLKNEIDREGIRL